MTSSLPGGPGSTAASSTYIRSQYNLNPPPQSSHGLSPDPLPPGYNGHGGPPGVPGSEGPPSTIGDFNWGNTTGSSLDGGSVLGSGCSGCHHNGHGGHHVAPGACQAVYLSSAMSTSSADSGSVSGSGSRTCGSASGGSGSAGGGSRRPSNFKSFPGAPTCHGGMSQPKAVFVRPSSSGHQPPSSPFKRPLLSSTPCDPELPSPGDLTSRGTGATVNPRGLNFTPLPAMAEVRSPDALHPQDGQCDCLSQGLQVRHRELSSGTCQLFANFLHKLDLPRPWPEFCLSGAFLIVTSLKMRRPNKFNITCLDHLPS